jgi:ribosomal protein S18 acetylase RimI-like enzyme
MTLRLLTAPDIPALQQISRQTFSETFAAHNTAENMRSYLEEQFSLDKLTTELNNPGSRFYFAVENDHPIGYLKLNSGNAQTELQEENGLEIERIYVSKAFLGKKIGQLLYEKAVEVARLQKAAYIWLGVWEENHRAIGFYKKNGFVEFDKHIFMLGDDKQTDIMMRLPL